MGFNKNHKTVLSADLKNIKELIQKCNFLK